MDGENLDLNILKEHEEKKLNLNNLLADKEKKLIFTDEILRFIQRFAEKYP